MNLYLKYPAILISHRAIDSMLYFVNKGDFQLKFEMVSGLREEEKLNDYTRVRKIIWKITIRDKPTFLLVSNHSIAQEQITHSTSQ